MIEDPEAPLVPHAGRPRRSRRPPEQNQESLRQDTEDVQKEAPMVPVVSKHTVVDDVVDGVAPHTAAD
ncbi:MAG: hypothetical protein ACOCT0_05660 [Halobacteriota archaeon]